MPLRERALHRDGGSAQCQRLPLHGLPANFRKRLSYNNRLPESDFHITGETKTYKKIAASGNERALVFCPICGTQMLGMPTGDGPKRISLRLGTSNQRAQLPPQRQIWCNSAMPWVEDLAYVPKSLTQD